MSIGKFGSKLLSNRSCFDSLEGNLFDGLSWIEVVGWFAIEVVCWCRLEDCVQLEKGIIFCGLNLGC